MNSTIRRCLGPALSLLLGLVAVVGASRLYDRAFMPGLLLQMAQEKDGGVTRLYARLKNRATVAVAVDGAGLEYFVMPVPGKPGQYIVRIACGEKRPAQDGSALIIPPGETRNLVDVLPVLESLPPGETILSAVFESKHPRESGFWHGTARAFPLAITVVAK